MLSNHHIVQASVSNEHSKGFSRFPHLRSICLRIGNNQHKSVSDDEDGQVLAAINVTVCAACQAVSVASVLSNRV